MAWGWGGISAFCGLWASYRTVGGSGGPHLLLTHRALGCRHVKWVRPPPSRPGTDSDNHPFCNKQETSLPASKIEQTKTPKYEALTVGQLRFLTLLPDSLQNVFSFFFLNFTREKSCNVFIKAASLWAPKPGGSPGNQASCAIAKAPPSESPIWL